MITRPLRLPALCFLLALLMVQGCSRVDKTSRPAAPTRSNAEAMKEPATPPTPTPAEPTPAVQAQSEPAEKLPPPPDRPPLSVADQVTGGIQLGMDLEEAKAARPELLVDKGPNEEVWWLSTKKEGFVIPSGGQVITICLKAPAEGQTARGLQVADPLAKVYALYGAPQQQIGSKYFYRSPDGTLSMVLQFMGTPPESTATVYSISMAKDK